MPTPAIIPLRPRLAFEGEAQAATTATIDIFDNIDPCWGIGLRELSDQLQMLGSVEQINVRIHSRGGSAQEGFAMMVLLMQHEAKVMVDIIGLAASSASVVAMSGDHVRIANVGHVMIHNPWCFAAGDAAEHLRAAEMLDAVRPSIIRAYKRRAKASVEELSGWMAQGNGSGKWFDADAALAAGLVDSIYEAPAPQMSISLDGLPEIPEGVLALYGQAPVPDAPPKETNPFAEVLDRLHVEEAQERKALEEVLAHLDELESPNFTVPSLVTAEELEAYSGVFESLVSGGQGA